MSSAPAVHPTAIIDPRASLSEDVSVGAYAIIKGPAEIGRGTTILEHTIINGPTVIGQSCRIGPAAFLGMDPQHLKFVPDDANPSWLVIGDNVIVREGARLNRAAHPGREHATRVGNDCFIMGAAHVGHDATVEDQVVLADTALLGGHCHIGQRSFLGGGCTVHQFVRVGRLSIIGGNEPVTQDVPPFAAVRDRRLKGYNAVGCRRSGMDRQTVAAIRACYQRLAANRTMAAAQAAIRAQVPDLPEVREILQFIESSKRGIAPAYRNRAAIDEESDVSSGAG